MNDISEVLRHFPSGQNEEIMTYQLLARLAGDGRIRRLQNKVANGCSRLSCHVSYNLMKLVRLDLPFLHPCREMAGFSIQPITGKRYKSALVNCPDDC